MLSIQLIEKFKKEHGITDHADYLELFIDLAGPLLGLVREFEDDSEFPEPYDQFTELLYDYFSNWMERIENPTKYRYLRYFWESGQNFIIPGYLSNPSEVEDYYPKIVALNLKNEWFDREGAFRLDRNIWQEVKWNKLQLTSLHKFYDDDITSDLWVPLIQELRRYSALPKYQLFVDAIEEMEKFEGQLEGTDYELIRDEWYSKFTSTQPFPINRLQLEKLWEPLVERRLEELNNELNKIQAGSVDPTLVLKEFYNQVVDKVDPTVNLKLLKADAFDHLSTPITEQEFERFINNAVAIRFRDQYYQLVNSPGDKETAPNASVEDLAVLANLMVAAKLFEKPGQAYIFLSKHFRISIKEKNQQKIKSPVPNTIQKRWAELKNSAPKQRKHYHELKNKFEELLRTEN